GAQTFSPPLFAVGNRQTDQIAIGAERIKRVAHHRRRGSRGGVIRILLGISDLADGRGPDPAAVFRRKRLNEFILQSLVAQHINSVADDGGSRIAVADVLLLPKQLRAFLGPLLEQTGLLRDAVAVWPAPLSPVQSTC